MDIQDVLRGIRFHAKRHPEPYNSWADEIERLKELLAEARDDIHDEVINRYPFRDTYPDDQRRYERDMNIVNRIDAALKPNPTP